MATPTWKARFQERGATGSHMNHEPERFGVTDGGAGFDGREGSTRCSSRRTKRPIPYEIARMVGRRQPARTSAVRQLIDSARRHDPLAGLSGD